MAYSDCTLKWVKTELNLQWIKTESLFAGIKVVKISYYLKNIDADVCHITQVGKIIGILAAILRPDCS